VRLVSPFLAPGAPSAAQSCSAYSSAMAFCKAQSRQQQHTSV
jgi:hypothetical protein